MHRDIIDVAEALGFRYRKMHCCTSFTGTVHKETTKYLLDNKM